MEKDNKIKEAVRTIYGELAEEASEGRCWGDDTEGYTGTQTQHDLAYSLLLGYSAEECDSAPADSNMGLGCGNPTAIANLKPGEIVLDLGSGGGFDCFLAVNKVGHAGKVIGVDMTPAMVSKARLIAERGTYANVEFRLGEIEYLPVADSSVDVVISNGVINLSTNKPRVFQEIHRALKPGGRIAIFDLVASKPLPEALKKGLESSGGNFDPFVSVDEVKLVLEKAGFHKISVQAKEGGSSFLNSWVEDVPEGKFEGSADEFMASTKIEAVKK